VGVRSDRFRRKRLVLTLDSVFLSRLQFAFVVSFHIIFPAFTIGLAAWLAAIESVRLKTGNPVYRRVFDFWLRIFALSFAMGVVSGIVQSHTHSLRRCLSRPWAATRLVNLLWPIPVRTGKIIILGIEGDWWSQ
jgi:Cytochrome bd terminal oxidase subunit I